MPDLIDYLGMVAHKAFHVVTLYFTGKYLAGWWWARIERKRTVRDAARRLGAPAEGVSERLDDDLAELRERVREARDASEG